MYRSLKLILYFVALSAVHSVYSQQLDLPDYAVDIQLGLSARPRMMGGNPEILGTPANVLGYVVFQSLVLQGYSQAYPWKLTLVNADITNASSTAGGQVYVYKGLLPVIGQNPGLWAAVLSHEIAHTGERHVVKLYVRQIYNQQMIQYYRARVLAGDNSANYALAAFQISSALLLKKMERDQEHQADQRGMLIMARAGYHPDFVFSLHHLLAMDVGDQSKFGAFFSDHPRWETRDQRSDRVYSDALAEFNRLWPDVAVSPGGKPPVVAFIGAPESSKNTEKGSADLKVPVYCRNSDFPVKLVVKLEKDHHDVRSLAPEFSDPRGNFSLERQVDCLDKNDALPQLVGIPATAVSDHDRSVKAKVFVVNDGTVIAASKTFDVHFPKPRK